MRRGMRVVLLGGALVALLVWPMGASALIDSGSVEIAEDSFHAISLPLNESTQVLVSISRTSGPRIDLFLLDSTNFELYRTGKQFVYASDGSRLDITKANLTVTISAGLWYIVLDNTDAGKAKPGLLDAFDKRPVVRFEVIHPFSFPPTDDQQPLLNGSQAIALSALLVSLLVIVLVVATRSATKDQQVADGSQGDPSQRLNVEYLPVDRKRP